ncbi:MAG: MFS transporter [Planctomycetes bacterium]|nr:MFS transporter [Planctomycetota bacterium]
MRAAVADTSAPTGLWADGRWRVLLFCWFGWVFDFYDLILFSFCKRTIAAELGLDAVAVGWIEGASLAATAVGGFLFGRLADRVGRRQAMVASIVVFSLGAMATGLATGTWSLLVARLVTGFGVGGEWGIGHAVVAESWRGRQRDVVHGILQAGSPVAMAAAAAVAFFVAPMPAVGWRLVFVLSAALGMLAFLGRWAMPVGRTSADAEANSGLPARALWQAPYRRASGVLLALLVLHMAGFWCVYAELPAALMGRHQVPAAQVGWFQIQVNAMHVLADVAFGLLAARCGRVRTFVAFCVLFALGHLVVLWQLDAIGRDFGMFTLAVVLMGLGAGTWSCFGALFGAHYPPALRATASATFYALARFVQLPLKPLLAGALAAGSFAPALWIGVGCALASAAVVLLLPRRGDAPGDSQRVGGE